MKMRKFRVLVGKHYERTRKREDGKIGRRYVVGDIVTTHHDLVTKFGREKFEEVQNISSAPDREESTQEPTTSDASTESEAKKTPTLIPQHRKGRWWDVIRVSNGKRINEKAMLKKEAEEVAGVKVEDLED